MSEEPKNFHDVARPNSTPQSSTSRPIIVDHDPILQDPMMKGQAPVPPKPSLPDHKDEPVVKPQTESLAPSANVEPADSSPEALPPSEVSSELVSSIPKEEDHVVKDLKIKEDDEQKAKIDQLIESKTYAVPVGHLKRKRTLRVVLIVGGIVLVVGAITAYIIASS